MARTKKVKASGRFGVRYGLSAKARWLAVEQKKKAKQKCPYCKKNCKRIAKGIWLCRGCERKFTGNAYSIK